jgi:hypothetical protein
MGNGIQITGLASSFDLGASNFGADAAPALALGASVSRAAAALPASTTGNLFTVTGGRILLTGIVGQVTTVIQTQACNASLVADPTVAGSNVALCGVLNISALAVGTLLSITGTAATAMQGGLAVVAMTTPWIIQPGAIGLLTSATNSGEISWKMWYMPLDTGAVVAAA